MRCMSRRISVNLSSQTGSQIVGDNLQDFPKDDKLTAVNKKGSYFIL